MINGFHELEQRTGIWQAGVVNGFNFDTFFPFRDPNSSTGWSLAETKDQAPPMSYSEARLTAREYLAVIGCQSSEVRDRVIVVKNSETMPVYQNCLINIS